MKGKIRTTGWVGILLLSVVMTSCYMGVSGNGDVEVREEKIHSFTRLEIDGNFDVFIRQGNEPELRIEADENLQELIRVRQSGAYLQIDSRENIIRAKRKSLYITCTDIEKIELNGAIDLKTESLLDVRTLAVSISGATDMHMEIQADKLWLEVSGAADCDLSGTTRQLTLDLSGAANFHALDMKARDVEITLSGAGQAKVHASETLNVEISGAGSVRYTGDPEIRKAIAGIGSLKRY